MLVEQAFARIAPFSSLELAFSIGKFDSVFGIEYLENEANLRTNITPSLIARYTTGQSLGLKAFYRIQIPGIRAWLSGQTYEEDGVTPHWRGIYDDDGRLMVAINFNMDLGDAWEHADDPRYPEPMTTLAYRFAVNYVVYAMTH